MNEATVAIARDSILAILRMLKPEEREEVAAALQFNDEFCWHCGYPHPAHGRCQCWNDE